MSQPLPCKGLKIDNTIPLDQVLETPDDSQTGYAIECDLTFPRELHEKFKEFPPCPENLTPELRWFSEFQRQVGEATNVIGQNENFAGTPKLIPHLMEHKNYVIHYRNLKFIKELGVEIGTVHNILKFKQRAWLGEYIAFNTEKRKEATDDFEKDFFKLMNNAVFGKTMENVKNRMDLHLTTDEENAKKWFSKINFKDCKSFDGLRLIEMFRKKIEYDKPLYVGTCVLDLSKLCMMDFHYNTIHENFENKYNLIYSDTDSLVYSIQHPDIYEWIKNNGQHFDLSDSKRSDMKDNANIKALGKFKDELNTQLIKEFLALNPKVYSILHQPIEKDGKMVEITKKCKGVSKTVVKKEISHQDYQRVLETNKKEHRNITSIRSIDHQVYTLRQQKVALTSFYDKMVMTDAINCHPFGYLGKPT